MSKRKKSSSKNRKTKFTPIAQQIRTGSVLKTPLSDLPIESVEWERDLMPEYIWIDLLAQEYKDLAWSKIYNDFLDRVDEVLEDDRKTPLLGLITDFGCFTDTEKLRFLSTNKEFIYNSFFKTVGKILTLTAVR